MNRRKMFSSSSRTMTATLWGVVLIYISVISEFRIQPCEARTVADSQEKPESIENTLKDSSAEFLRTYSDRMKSYMNVSVAPCDDFYEYACGNWQHVKQDRQSSHKRSNLLDIGYTLGDVVELLLTKNSLAMDLNYTAELLIAQRFYNACLGADLYPLPAADPAYLALIRSIGGFPAVDGEAWHAANFSWFNMSAHLTNFGINGLIHEKILPQYPFVPYFKVPELGFDYIVHSDNIASNDTRGYKLNEKRMRGYLEAYGLSEEKVSQVIAEVFAFWHDALVVIDRFGDDLKECEDHAELNDIPSFSEWSSYYAIAWNSTNFPKENIETFCDFYYVELDKVCAKHMPAVANYLAMLLLYRMDAKLKSAKYQKEHCLQVVQYSLPYLFDRLYRVEYFSEETSAEISGIIKELRKSFRLMLENSEWLDKETRTEALLKEISIEPRIGSFRDDGLTERLVRAVNNLTIVKDSFAQTNINLKRFITYLRRFNGHHFSELSNDTKPLELLWSMQVNAFYYNLDNTIYVMAGILHPPAFHQLWPNSLKYGTIGYLVGHELTHGFDTVGSMYDGSGAQRNWWSKKSNAVFNERAECYAEHYSNYLIPEINRKINGNQTKDENIADSGGLHEALAAYRSYMKQQHQHLQQQENETHLDKNEEQMPGLDLSPEQLFFLGFAQLWCNAYEEEHYWEELSNEHTIDKFRVLGAVTNNEDFAKIYNCPVGSPMNPHAERCRVW
ncbi:neprilysin-2 [Drosophila miranda]|uniref:neprilysin-2 n=1 Tax=Drosophila miranda TaxID=7229 RepID=UPI0007E722C8|nr:neprilysin-2 [Drosophila miranda]